MRAAADSSDDGLRRDLASFGHAVGPELLGDAVHRLGAAWEPDGAELGDFRLGRELGRGGMGVVYEAEQHSVPGRRVAVKVLPGLGDSATARQRFAREVEVAGQLDHPHIVPVLAADVTGPHPWYAMKLVDGVSLRDLLTRGELHGDVRRVVTLVRDLARALQHAHERGVVHRDVKPGNVVVDGAGRAMLLDFGLARVLEDVPELTRSLDAIGTPDYMAPEQVDRRFGPITPRTDVYGLGVTLFECLTGGVPFAAPSRTATLDRIVRGDAPRLRTVVSGLARDLENVCAKAIERQPARRYASAAELADDLDAFLGHRPVCARPPGFLRRIGGVVRRHRLAAAASLVAAGTFAVAAGYWGWWRPAREVDARLAAIDELWRRREAVVAALADGQDEVRRRREAERRPGLDVGLAAREQQVRRLRRDQGRLDADLEASLEACLAVDPHDPGTNARLARLIAAQLAAELRGNGVLTRRDDIARAEARLRRHDLDGSHAALLEPTGRLSVRCADPAARVWLCPARELPDGRSVHVAIDDAAAHALGTPPIDGAFAEGSYALRAEVLGRAPVVLPLLLRRAAVQTDAEAVVELALPPPAAVADGFVWVHGGVGVSFDPAAPDESPLGELRTVEAFAISEREVSGADLARWLGALPDGLDGRRADRPLGGFDWPQIADLLHRLNEREHRRASGWYVALPTPAEWERAGRGADGRPYPWGFVHDWSWSQNYWSSIDASMALLPARWPDEDTSPFGVRDLAGSLREICRPDRALQELGNKQFLLQGGSHYSFRAADLRLSSSRALLHNQPAADVGLRFVRRPLPPQPTGPRRVRLDAAGGLPAGWRLVAVSGPFVEPVPHAGRLRVVDGAVVLSGFGGNFSPQLMLWHGLDVPATSLRATASLSFRHASPQDRAFELRFGTRPGFEAHDRCLACMVGSTALTVEFTGLGRRVRATAPVPDLPHGTPFRLDVTAEATQVRVRLTAGADLCVESRLERPSDAPIHYRYVAARLPTYVGMTATITDLSVEDG